MNIQLQILPLLSVLVLFLVAPVAIILAVSFWDYTEFSLIPDFVLTNYIEIFESALIEIKNEPSKTQPPRSTSDSSPLAKEAFVE